MADRTGAARLAGVHHKRRWLATVYSLAKRVPVRRSAERCGAEAATAYCGQHRVRVQAGPVGRHGGNRRDLCAATAELPSAPGPIMSALGGVGRVGLDHELLASHPDVVASRRPGRIPVIPLRSRRLPPSLEQPPANRPWSDTGLGTNSA